MKGKQSSRTSVKKDAENAEEKCHKRGSQTEETKRLKRIICFAYHDKIEQQLVNK